MLLILQVIGVDAGEFWCELFPRPAALLDQGAEKTEELERRLDHLVKILVDRQLLSEDDVTTTGSEGS